MRTTNKNKITCKAASNSLLFQPSGEILPCHYNRGYILGAYPENSILEVWNGKKRKNLLKSITKNKFNLGCYACKEMIDKGLTESAGFNKYQYITDSNNNFPVSMEFQLDNICNLECIMCSGEYSSGIRKNREKGAAYLSPYDDEFINQLEKFIPHLKYASFTGGEPFISDIYYKIWDRILVLNPDIQLYISTNGTILNERVIDYLKKLKFNLSISIDSINKETYEKIRKNAKLEETLTNIEWFNNYCKSKYTQINIKSLVTPQNIFDLPELYQYCNLKSLPLHFKTAILPWFARIENLNKTKLYEAINKLEKLFSNHDSEILVNNNKRLVEIVTQLKKVRDNKTSSNNRCDLKDISNLKQELIKYILCSKNKMDSSISLDDNFYIRQLNILFDYISDENLLKISIQNFLEIPAEIIVSELNRKNIEKLGQRFIQASLTNTTEK